MFGHKKAWRKMEEISISPFEFSKNTNIILKKI